MKPLALVLVPAAALVALSGCGGSVSTGSAKISSSTLESKVSAGLEKSVGKKPDDISCPSDLKVKLNASERCTLTDAGQSIGLTVKVDQVDGTKYHLAIAVDDAPQQ